MRAQLGVMHKGERRHDANTMAVLPTWAPFSSVTPRLSKITETKRIKL